MTAVPAFADSPSHATIPAALDTSFGTDGMQVLSISEGVDYIRSLKLLSSGKILAVGAVNNHFGLLRFNSDLSLDTSFGTGGVVETSVGNDNNRAVDVIEHPEGGLLVVGKDNLIRYTDDGALDTSFGTNGIADGYGRFDWGCSVAITADGRIVVGGDRHDGGGTWWQQAYFSLSGDFLGGDQYAYQSRAGSARSGGIYPLGDGTTVMVGSVNPSYGGFITSVRLDPDGNTIAEHTMPSHSGNVRIESSMRLPDGKILVIGRDDYQLYVGRFNQDGSVDSSFGSNGGTVVSVISGRDQYGYGVGLQADGKILLVGDMINDSNHDIAVARLNYDGSLDTSFDGDGAFQVPDLTQDDETGYAVLALPDGKILIAGGTGTPNGTGLREDIALVKLLGDSDQDAIAVNEAPVNVVPGAQTSRVNHAISFNAYQGNQISISDADAGPHLCG